MGAAVIITFEMKSHIDYNQHTVDMSIIVMGLLMHYAHY